MVQSGAVWMPVLPDMSKWNATLRAGMSMSSLSARGRQAGESFSTSMMRAVKNGISPMSATVVAQAKAAAKEAAAAFEASSRKVVAARVKEENAAGRVRVAESKLEELRAKGKATDAQLAAAEERLATAKRALTTASTGVERAEWDERTAHEANVRAMRAEAEATATSRGRFAAMSSTVSGGATRMTSKLGGFAKAVGGMAGLFAGFEVAKFAGESLKGATEFQKSTSVLVTAAGETWSNLKIIRKGIVDISNDTGTATNQLSEGMYTIEKAGYRGAAGLKILDAAAKGAKEENADLGTVTNAMTSIMASYGIKTDKSVQVMNELKTAAALSKTSMQNFAGSLSTVLPIASANHISFANIAGALGTLTSHGTSAQEATQELAFSIRSLSAPNAVAIKEMGQFGISSQDVSTHLGKRGLQGTIELLSETVLKRMGPAGKVLLNTFYASTSAAKSAAQMYDALSPAQKKLADAMKSGSMSMKDWTKEAKGTLAPEQYNQLSQWATLQKKATGFNDAIKQGLPGSQTYSEAMKKMMGGATGLNTALMLTGTSAEATQKRTDEISKSYANNAKEVEGWKATQQTAAVAQDRMKNSLKNAGMVMATAFLPSLTKMTTGLANGITNLMKFGQTNWSWLKYVAGGLGAIVASLTAFSIVTGIQSLVLKLATSMGLMTAATEESSAAWVGLDGAMDANPIGLVVMAITALGIGLVVAYQKVGWFRDAVNAAWSGIKTAVSAVTDWWQKTAWPALKTGFDAVGSAATWLWKNAIQPAFNGIQAAASAVVTGAKALWSGIQTAFNGIVAAGKFMWGYVLGPIFALWLAANIAVAKGVIWLWNSAIHPFFQKIGDFGKWLWNVALKPAFDSTVAGLKQVGNWGMWLYNNAIHPAFQKIGDFATWLWTKGIKPDLDAINSGLKMVGHWANWLWDSAIHPAWNSIGAGMHAVYTTTIHPVILGFQKIIKDLKSAFSDTVTGIGDAWSGLTSVISHPINVVIGFIDDHFIKGFNNIMSSVPGVKLRLPMIPKISTGSSATVGHGGGHQPGAPGMARGGVLPGSSSWRHGDDQMVPMRRGEGVYVSEAMRDPFERARLFAVNAAAMAGKSLAPYQGGFSIGGIVGSIGNGISNVLGAAWDAAKVAGDFMLHPGKMAATVVNKLLGGIGNTWPAQVMESGLKSIPSAIGAAIKSMLGGGGNGDSSLGNVGGGRGWQWMWKVIHSKFPGAVLTSAYRPGAIVAGSGQQSMHAIGRAIDIGGSVPELTTIARWIAAHYGSGPMTQLLYTPAFGNMGIYDGHWYPQPAVTVAEHGNHVHWGYSRGGVVDEPPVFDQGGVLAPGINVVDNRLGRPERLVRADRAGTTIHSLSLPGIKTLQQLEQFLDQYNMRAQMAGGVNG